MSGSGPGALRRHPLQTLVAAGLLLAALALQAAFLANMIRWREAPDRGWISMAQLGPNVIWQTRPLGEEAGLRTGDEILSINGERYETRDEMLALLDLEIGATNVYEIRRGERVLRVPVTTRPLGVARVALQSGVFWLLGSLFVALGLLVFLMKPYHGPSWAFLALATAAGVTVTYFAPSAPLEPRWLDRVALVLVPFLPSALLGLTAYFPQRHAFIAEHPRRLLPAFALSAGLAAAALALAPKAADLPPGLFLATYGYLLASVAVFLGVNLWSFLRARSPAVRLQSLVIFTGLGIAFLPPVVELFSNLAMRRSFFPYPLLFYLAFLGVFPLSIAYAIVRHDLFEIDVIVRRTYGYLLSTAIVLGLHAVTVSSLNVAVGPSDVLSSPFFAVGFVLAMVFFMQPLQGRIQRVVDRAFYRQQYDYRATIGQVSERMTTLLDPEDVQRTLVGSVVEEMFLENGLLLLVEGEGLRAGVVTGEEPPVEPGAAVTLAPALARVLLEGREPVFRHEIELAPRYEGERDALRASFDALEAELMMPIVLQGAVRAVLSLGRKKSGRMFTREDVDLLRTLCNQSAIALENARLFDEVAANLKQIQMLESVKSGLAKFVPRTVQALLEESPDEASLFEKKERDLSVMFADMTGYTRLSSHLPMDRVNAIIERYFGAFLDAILREGGDVNETAGDGLMVLFQAEDPEEHARAAVRAALEIQRLTRELNAERAREEPDAIEVGMHIGVNSGVASVGATKIGGTDGARWTYTASGPTTNVAARVGALGEEVAITDETRRRLGEDFVAEALGPRSLKNVPAPVLVHRVTGLRGAEVPRAAAPEAGKAPGAADEAPRRFRIRGTLRERGTGRPLPGHVVRAFDKDHLFDDELGRSVSDPGGAFEIRFSEGFRDLFETRPDVYLRIFDPSGRRELLSTEEAVRWNAGAEESFELEIPTSVNET